MAPWATCAERKENRPLGVGLQFASLPISTWLWCFIRESAACHVSAKEATADQLATRTSTRLWLEHKPIGYLCTSKAAASVNMLTVLYTNVSRSALLLLFGVQAWRAQPSVLHFTWACLRGSPMSVRGASPFISTSPAHGDLPCNLLPMPTV